MDDTRTLYLVRLANGKYVGGALTATGYGATPSRAMAISFLTADEAQDWIDDYGPDGSAVEAYTIKGIL